MSKSKVISTLAWLINYGIGTALYHDSEKNKKLKGAKAYWNGNILCVSIGDKTYKLQMIEGD